MLADTRPADAPDYAAALSRLAHRERRAAVLTVSGPDRATFLQGQLTQDVRGLETGQARFAAGLTPKGKLLYFGWLVAEAERLLLVLPDARPDAILAHLSRYAAFHKVTLADATSEFLLLGLYGPEASGFDPGTDALRIPREREISAGILAPASTRGALDGALARAASVPLSTDSAEALRVEAGRPRMGQDADESSLPDEIGLGDAISSVKGCYVGQEVVARLRTYGKVSRRLAGLRFPGGGVARGTVFRDPEKPEHELLRVTSVAVSPRFGPIGLGLAARDVAEGRAFTADNGARAVVAPLPFA